MTRADSPPRLVRIFAFAILLVSAASAQTPPAVPKPAAKKDEPSGWVFSLLPKSLQKNPRLDLTVITEMTELGKKLPPVSPEQPAYYQAFSSGSRQLGHAAGNEKNLAPEFVERLLTRSLAANGYLPATPPAHPPTLVIFYTWGSHNLLVEGDADNPSLSAELVARNLLDRAALVGGEKFARELLQLFTEADAMALGNRTPPADPSGAVEPIQPILGAAQMEFFNPVNLFKQRSVKNAFLVDQTAEDVYYVVASAYDFQSVATKQKRLLWRTRMTANTRGVSQEQSLPTLIASAAPYFGKEMAEPEILTPRAVREGTVEVGTPTVVPPAAEKKP